MEKEIDDIIDVNSFRINFFRNKIENASVAKIFLLDMLEEE